MTMAGMSPRFAGLMLIVDSWTAKARSHCVSRSYFFSSVNPCAEIEICRSATLRRMPADQQERRQKWYVRERWGLIPTFFGAAILSFVVATGVTRWAWMLWIAVPLLMIGLAYFYVVNALPIFLNKNPDQRPEPSEREERLEK